MFHIIDMTYKKSKFVILSDDMSLCVVYEKVYINSYLIVSITQSLLITNSNATRHEVVGEGERKWYKKRI